VASRRRVVHLQEPISSTLGRELSGLVAKLITLVVVIARSAFVLILFLRIHKMRRQASHLEFGIGFVPIELPGSLPSVPHSERYLPYLDAGLELPKPQFEHGGQRS